jgi:hypothetical protein
MSVPTQSVTLKDSQITGNGARCESMEASKPSSQPLRSSGGELVDAT